jgi:exodeoxyribonuclease VII large subunit
MFRSAASTLSFTPKDGTLVRCTGKLTVYPARGNYQILITKMEIAGAGNILQMLEERKKKLAAEGLFESSRKRKLPSFPRTVGIVTSPTGAALRDILQITKRRNSSVSVVIFPALVQGDDAAESIVRQIRAADSFRMCDVLIVGRGGGSLEDLLPFSDERVVRAIAASEIPVVSAVGHEIDWALSDYAADVRAPTPSAAAELVIPLKADIMQNLQSLADDLYNTIRQKVENMKLVVRTFNPENLELQFRTIEQPLLARFDNVKVALLQNMDTKLKDTRQHIEMCIQILESASPETILARGYSMVCDKNTRKIIRDASQAETGTEIEIVPARGKLTAQVISVDER